MNKMVELANSINEREFKFGERSMNQTQRNALKKEVLDTLLETFDGAGLDVERVNDGVAVILQANKQVVITFDAVIKNIDYDVDFEKSEYELKLEKQLERELERKRKAESKK